MLDTQGRGAAERAQRREDCQGSGRAEGGGWGVRKEWGWLNETMQNTGKWHGEPESWLPEQPSGYETDGCFRNVSETAVI